MEVHDAFPRPIRGAGNKGKGLGAKKGGPGKKGKGKGPGAKKAGAGLKKAGPGNKGKGAGPKNGGAKKPSWGKKPQDPEKEVLFDQDAEKQTVEKKQGGKKGKQAGPKNGKGNGKGKKAGMAAKKNPARPNDARFFRTQGAYRAFAASNEAVMPKALGLKPAHYSLKPRFCKAPNTPTSPALQAGNVLTVEPGLYFNKYMLNNFFMKNKKHAQFIDKEVLAKFMGVGGVRVEDTVLITETGCEVLSAGAPKGAEMINVIKESAFVTV